MVGSAVVSAQFLGGKAAQNALYLSYLDVTTLPGMIVATSILSIAVVALASRIVTRVAPGLFVTISFVLSALLLVGEWLLSAQAPKVAAILLYLHVAGLGPMLGSGFWLITTEYFDPRTAKHRFGQIASAGTLGGLAGGLLAIGIDQAASMWTMLPILAVLNLFCAWQVQRLAGRIHSVSTRVIEEVTPELLPVAPRSGLRVLAEAPYLRNLAVLVLLGTFAAALLDYVFRAQAVELVSTARLGQFFGIYVAATSFLTFILQTTASRRALEKLKLAANAGSPSVAILATGAGALLLPAFRAPIVVGGRGAESVLRASLFRSGYELFYTPLAIDERRAAKSVIDVGFDRLGELIGAGAIALALALPLAASTPVMLVLAILASGIALFFAARLNRGYIGALERSLLNRAVELELSEVTDITTRSVMLKTLWASRTMVQPVAQPLPEKAATVSVPAASHTIALHADPEVQKILTLRSRDRQAIVAVLRQTEDLPPSLIPHLIQLLAWDPVAEESIQALRKVAEFHVGEFSDALLDPNQPFAVRRRLARVFSVCVSQRAADGLLAALDDLRFEVRFQCARSLAAIMEKNPRVRMDSNKVYDVVHREVAVGRPVWEGHRLLDSVDDPDDVKTFLDDYLKGRASQSLTHVFTLLSLVLPMEPLRIAFKGLHTSDPNLRGTSLEYLEGVLPPAIRERLWPFLEDRPGAARGSRPRSEILADLLRSNQSITLNLEELKQQARDAQARSPQSDRVVPIRSVERKA
jgi:ATP/ADP translocase